MAQVKRAQDKHRRDMLLRGIAPVAAVGAVILLIALAILFAAPQSIGVVASFMTAVILFPMVLLCLIPYAILLAMIAGMVFVNKKMSSIMVTVLTYSYRINRYAIRASRSVTGPVITINKRVAFVERIASDVITPDGRSGARRKW